ncbi:hypothetical protein AVEN_46192-1 [Araneus ventricosus]|uniref:Uncharacterized protein n=1 Tax=Araneus ventricosus TaxID=182803 RepID=A0A4Y2E6C4_ARAVE|nr:hypothetical protein AVEN_46192-1 [Araneus ventricosus]
MEVYRTSSTEVLGVPPRQNFKNLSGCADPWSSVVCWMSVNVILVKLFNVPTDSRTIDIKSQITNSQFDVYMDGSRIGDNTGLSVGILKNEHHFKIFKFKLNKNNAVFQVELAAINFAGSWRMASKLIEALRSSRPH